MICSFEKILDFEFSGCLINLKSERNLVTPDYLIFRIQNHVLTVVYGPKKLKELALIKLMSATSSTVQSSNDLRRGISHSDIKKGLGLAGNVLFTE